MSSKHLIYGVALANWTCLNGCGTGSGSIADRFGKPANLPLYYLVAGERENAGVLYRLGNAADGETAESTPLVSGLNQPLGLAQDFAGNLYISELLPEPDGSIQKILAGSSTAANYLSGLDLPSGVAVDSLGQVFVMENGKHRIIKIDGSDTASAFIDTEISSPESGVFDSRDDLFLVEIGNNVVSRIAPSSVRTIVSPFLDGLRSVTVSPSGDVFALVVNPIDQTGQIVRLSGTLDTEEVAAGLINPASIACDSFGFIYISEGAPANRISSISLDNGEFRVIGKTPGEPGAMVLTPF